MKSMKKYSILIFLTILLASCTKEAEPQPKYYLSGSYIATAGALLPIGQNVLFKSRYLYFSDMGIPYTMDADSIYFHNDAMPDNWHYQRYAWGVIVNTETDTAVLLKSV